MEIRPFPQHILVMDFLISSLADFRYLFRWLKRYVKSCEQAFLESVKMLRPKGIVLRSPLDFEAFTNVRRPNRRSRDNAGMESFWATLKTELIDGQVYATRAEAKSAIFRSIEVFYNRARLHGALGFQSPVDFEHNLN